MKNKENWLKWFFTVIPALIVVFIICYALQWVLWKWLWLAIPIWIFFYFFNKKYGTVGDYETTKLFRHMEKHKHINQNDHNQCNGCELPIPINFWEKFKDKLKRYLP